MFISFEGCIVDPVPDPAPDSVIDADADVDDVGPDLSVSPASPINEEIEEVEPLGGDIGGNPVYADEEVDSISDMLMEIPRIDYNRDVCSPDLTPDPTPDPPAAPSPVLACSPSPIPVPPAVSEPPAPSRPVPVSAPEAPPVSVSWNDSTLSPNHATSFPYVQPQCYCPPFSSPYHPPVPPYYPPASSEFGFTSAKCISWGAAI